MEVSQQFSYKELVVSLKQRIASARVKAALAVNEELIYLYWDIGYGILKQQKEKGWGTKVIEQLSKDLKGEFPEMKGLSRSNMFYMRKFAEVHPALFVQQAAGQMTIVQQAVGQIPWGHNIELLNKLNTNEERTWYAEQTIEYGWSRSVLVHQIESDLYVRQNKVEKITNVQKLLPKAQSDLVQQTLKDPYVFDFLNLSKEANERELEDGLERHIIKFLQELGKGFAFVGRQHKVEVDDKEYFIDLLFYHIKLKCYVVIELKVVDFEPSFAGQLNFYTTVIDKQLADKNDNPTIGILLCKSKSNIVAEYALDGINTPMAVSEYSLSKKIPKEYIEVLPTPKELSEELKKITIIEGRNDTGMSTIQAKFTDEDEKG